MPPAGRGGRGGRGRGAGQGGAPPAPLPFLFSPVGRSVPVMVHVGLGGVVGPADNVGLVAVPSNSLVVIRTPFARWQATPPAPDGIARMALASCQMSRIFLGKCCVGPALGDRAAASQAHPFTARLTADAWSRILSALLDGGLFTETYQMWDPFERALAALEIANPDALHLVAADWAFADALVVPPAVQDQDLHDRMAYLRFLTFGTVTFLEDLSEPSKPLEKFSCLVGALGPCFAQPSRENEMAPLHFVAQQLRDHVCARAVPDGQAAFGLKRLMSEIRLPPVLRPTHASVEDLSSELLDAIQYSTPSQRAAVEQRRINILGARSASQLHLVRSQGCSNSRELIS